MVIYPLSMVIFHMVIFHKWFNNGLTMINPLTSGGSRCLVGGLEHFLFVHSVGNNDLN
jgi:hypothetical protein